MASGIRIIISCLVICLSINIVSTSTSSSMEKGYSMYEFLSFRVETYTNYIETASVAIGDMNGNGYKDIAVVYDDYSSNNKFMLAVYEYDGINIYKLSSINDFKIGTPGIIVVEPTNTYMYDYDDDGKDELFIYGTYNGSTGVFVFSLSSNGTLNLDRYFGGSDSAILLINNIRYLVVSGDGIYRIDNGNFIYINATESISSGFVRTGNFSNNSNIAVLEKSYDSAYINFYSFKNEILTKVYSLSLNIPVEGWGNDVGYIVGYCKAHLIPNYYDMLFIVTYHNGYTTVSYKNAGFEQITTGVLNAPDDNAMCCAAGKIFGSNNTDRIVVGFDNYIYAALFRIYDFNNGDLTEIYSQPAEEGNTRVITIGDVNNDGTNDVVLGSKSRGYVRAFTERHGCQRLKFQLLYPQS